ncbi:hypothetical protein L4B77_20020, partial [Vibrio minamisatsumaniensis]
MRKSERNVMIGTDQADLLTSVNGWLEKSPNLLPKNYAFLFVNLTNDMDSPLPRICHTYVVLNCTEGTMSDFSYFCGIDLAKNHFSLHAVDKNGKVILHKSVTRSKLLTTIANMPLMRIGVEACGGAHYW